MDLTRKQKANLYVKWSKHKYSKYRHQYPRMRQSELVRKIIDQWEGLSSQQRINTYHLYLESQFIVYGQEYQSEDSISFPSSTKKDSKPISSKTPLENRIWYNVESSQEKSLEISMEESIEIQISNGDEIGVNPKKKARQLKRYYQESSTKQEYSWILEKDRNPFNQLKNISSIIQLSSSVFNLTACIEKFLPQITITSANHLTCMKRPYYDPEIGFIHFDRDENVYSVGPFEDQYVEQSASLISELSPDNNNLLDREICMYFIALRRVIERSGKSRVYLKEMYEEFSKSNLRCKNMLDKDRLQSWAFYFLQFNRIREDRIRVFGFDNEEIMIQKDKKVKRQQLTFQLRNIPWKLLTMKADFESFRTRSFASVIRSLIEERFGDVIIEDCGKVLPRTQMPNPEEPLGVISKSHPSTLYAVYLKNKFRRSCNIDFLFQSYSKWIREFLPSSSDVEGQIKRLWESATAFHKGNSRKIRRSMLTKKHKAPCGLDIYKLERHLKSCEQCRLIGIYESMPGQILDIPQRSVHSRKHNPTSIEKMINKRKETLNNKRQRIHDKLKNARERKLAMNTLDNN